jgi:trans-aconitate methyltransferase
MSTDRDWEKWGKTNPYYGVISHEEYLGETLTDDVYEQFFRSGRQNVEKMLGRIEELRGGKSKKFKLALDYGCGVGRLSYALADHAKQVVGMDVAPSMLRLADTNPKRPKNTEFRLADRELSELPSSYDLLVSYIVFQHIPPRVGMPTLRKLLDRLEPGGCFALQLTYAHDASILAKLKLGLREWIPPLRYIANIARGRKYDTPNMRMHSYDLNRVHQMLQDSGVKRYSAEMTDHGGYLGVFLYGVKKKSPSA